MADGAPDELLDILARNARAARLRRGLSLEEVADAAELDVLTLDAIERGEGRRLTVPALGRLARALGVAASGLLDAAARRTDPL